MGGIFVLLALLLGLWGQEVNFSLASPKPPAKAKTFTWKIASEHDWRPLIHAKITGCWTSDQIESVAVNGVRQKQSDLPVLHVHDQPVQVSITFRETFESSSNAATLSYKQGGREFQQKAAGPVCKPPLSAKPTAQNVLATSNEDEAKTITLSAHDADSTSLNFAATQPAHGSLSAPATSTCKQTGGTNICTTTVQYTPDADFNGDDSFTYTATDDNSSSVPATVAIKVNPVNDPPVFTDDTGNTAQAIQTGEGLSALKAIDKENDPLAFSVKNGDLPPGISLKNDGSFDGTASAGSGEYTVVITVSDGKGGTDETTLVVKVTNPGSTIPPDPSTVAPPLDGSQFASLGDTIRFLYSGNNPIQTGANEGTIQQQRAAVLRGKVLDQDGNPLSGVAITILNHPEFGSTKSRADGMFDMAVNGGQKLAIVYQKQGYLMVQRTVDTPWRDFRRAPDVAMTQLDERVTNVIANQSNIQVARGNQVNDSDGARQATLLFPEGTTAEMTLPNGTKQSLSDLHVRATEYTVGTDGPQAMPGVLPSTSAYTYATELSVDEAIAANAKTVSFNKAVPFYVENFLNFPNGSTVPVGYYDRDKAKWIASDNGKVIRIISITNGKAVVSLDSTGFIAASAEALAAAGITDAELERLGSLYTEGTSLWRAPIKHFTPWDLNWPYGPPNDAEVPSQPEPKEEKPEDDPCKKSGSIIECQNQVLGERLPVTGTPFSLNYRSNRQVDYKAANLLKISLTDATPSASLKRIELQIQIAGRTFDKTFEPATNLTYEFAWDRKDAYGRTVSGFRNAAVTIKYVYQAQYRVPAQSGQSFGLSSATVMTANRTRMEITLTQNFERGVAGVGAIDERNKGLGGWSLNAHHSYDPEGQKLMLGDGSTRSSQSSLAHIIGTAAGTGDFGNTGDGGPATQAQLRTPHGVAVGSDGSVYFTSTRDHTVRRITPDGVITTIAGTGTPGFSGDGGPAKQAQLFGPESIAISSDGSVYIADATNARIRRIAPDGTINTVAGTGQAGYGGDNGPAAQAKLNYPYSIAFGSDDSLYIADYHNQRVRRITVDGTITTFAGTGTFGFSGDNGHATQAKLGYPQSVAVGPDDSVYIADTSNLRIRRVTPEGTITTFAGTGQSGFAGDGGPATQAKLESPANLAVSPDGNVYISDYNSWRIRRISSHNIITTVVGGGDSFDDNVPATQARVRVPWGIAFSPDGTLYIAESDAAKIRKVTSAFKEFSQDTIPIASEDGSEVYLFTPQGRHLRTINSRTGATIYEFAYDAGGRLTQVSDGDGNVTSVERESSGAPKAVVGPYGQRTTLAVNANGYLQSVTNPANEKHSMAYSDSGLLLTFTDAKNQSSQLAYDDLGRLTKDQNAAGGSWNIARQETSTGHTTMLTSELDRKTIYQVLNISDGTKERNTTAPDGTQTKVQIKPSGITQKTDPDGTTVTTTTAPNARFGMQAPLDKSLTVKTPKGLQQTLTTQQTTHLSDPQDLLGLTSETTETTVNNKTTTETFNASTKQYTHTTPAGRERHTTVDAQERPLTIRVDGLAQQNLSYDTRGRLTSIQQGTGTDERKTTLTYNPQGYISSISNPANQTEQYNYDAAGRLIQKTLPNGNTIAWSYDRNGNVTSITPAGKPKHESDYTAVNQEKTYTPPPVAGVADTTTHFEYNLDGQATKLTLPGNQTVSYDYDNGGRLNQITHGGNTITLNRSASTGQLTNLNTSQGINLSYTYDGMLPTSETWSGPVAGTVTQTYNNDFNVTGITVNSDTVDFTYDNDGLLTKAGQLTLTRSSQHELITGTVLNAVTTAYTYNQFGEPGGLQAKHGDTSLLALQYERDKIGRPIKKVQTRDGNTAAYDYTYDNAGQLTEVKKDGAIQTTYQYDANGNRLSKTTPAGQQQGTYDDQDRLLSYGDTTYSYTPSGDLRSKNKDGKVTNYTYDALGNLRNATLPNGDNIEYLVDGKNRLVGKRLNGAVVRTFLYQDQLKPVAQLNAVGGIVARFVYGTKPNVPEYMVKDGNTYRIITDDLGSPLLVVNTSNGDVAQRLSYDEFGNVLEDTNPGFQPFGFGGGLYDHDTKLVHFDVRDYDTETGRWLTQDPVRFAGGANLYAYVGNSPLQYNDPSGLAPGDTFPTRDAAALDAGKYARTFPMQGIEYGGYIYPQGSSYTYNFGKGTPKNIPREVLNRLKAQCPSAPTDIWHTHPDPGSEYFNEFSADDKLVAKEQGLPVYLKTPMGPTIVYNPATDRVRTVGR